MPGLDFPKGLPGLVARRFREAQAAGALTLSETVATTFLLQYCPALSKKPVPAQYKPQHQQSHGGETSQRHADSSATTSDTKGAPSPGDAARKTQFDPFADPSPELFIADVPLLSPQHYLILNKYPIIPEHFILATKRFQPQTAYLTPSDLEVTYGVLQAWQRDAESDADGMRASTNHSERERERQHESDSDYHAAAAATSNELFAFFNSGEHSGASQPHRHLQFLPIRQMGPRGSDWTPLIYRLEDAYPRADGVVPFAWFAVDLPRGAQVSGRQLHDAYLGLLRRAIDRVNDVSPDCMALAAAETPARGDAHSHMDDGGRPVEISYNLAMTTSRMVICPRLAEGSAFALPDGQQGEVTLNGTVLAGTVLAKEYADYEAIAANPRILEDVLAKIGVADHMQETR
ncbi:bifunctional AP-4-A phosphorylase/ADP sulfurylase [Ascosphaera acerosa]|nr:bifunctional AP-4-A phosphorylase/ADP sulfurylase [Ascosphaera acerosa]